LTAFSNLSYNYDEYIRERKEEKKRKEEREYEYKMHITNEEYKTNPESGTLHAETKYRSKVYVGASDGIYYVNCYDCGIKVRVILSSKGNPASIGAHISTNQHKEAAAKRLREFNTPPAIPGSGKKPTKRNITMLKKMLSKIMH
jgi:hypothetical protein